jgi:RHS repeat-associated protein
MVMERAPQGADSAPEAEGFNLVHSPLPGDGSAMRNYIRQYAYDEVGNILSMIHTANNGNWTRNYAYNTTNNHLQSTTTGSTTLSYTHNVHGLMTAMPHLEVMDWDFTELDKTMVFVEVQIVPADYLSFGSKQLGCCRAKLLKSTLTNTASVSNTHLEYLHLSTMLPHCVEGSASYQSGNSASEVKRKRYRYTGKEKDEESGLYYHGARYYAAWLGRWTAADPIGVGDGVNVYAYVQGNPVRLVDPTGMEGEDVTWDVPESVKTEEDFRNWVYDNAGAYINGDVSVEITDDGRRVFNYNDSDIEVDEEAREEILGEGKYPGVTSKSERNLLDAIEEGDYFAAIGYSFRSLFDSDATESSENPYCSIRLKVAKPSATNLPAIRGKVASNPVQTCQKSV